MADPARGALVAKLGEKGAGIETKLLFFGLEWAAIEDESADAAAAGSGARPLAPLARGAARLPPLPPDRAGGEDRHREGRLGRLVVVAPLRGGARRDPRRPRRRARAGRARDRDVAALPRRPGRAPRRRRGGHGGAAADAADAHVRLQHDPPRQVDRRPAARLPDVDHVPQPRERDLGRRRAGAGRRRHLPLRRPAAVLPAEGEAARARPARALRPLRAGRRGRDEDALERGAADRRRRVLELLGRGRRGRRAVLRRRAGSTRPCGRTSGTAPTARRTSPASIRTCS